jgi:hypothetical protein
MYIYDRQSSSSQYRRKEQPATWRPSRHYNYPAPSQGQSGFWGQGLGQAAAPIDMDRAVHLNRYYARSLGWQSHVHRIIRFLRFTTYNPDERTFAKTIAHWQHRQGLPGDGIISPTTWSRMRAALGVQDLSRSPQLGVAALAESAKIRQKQVRDLIKSRDPEVYALIERIPLPCKVDSKGSCRFGEVRRRSVGTEEHVWTLAVRYVGHALLDGGKTQEISPPTRTSIYLAFGVWGTRVINRILIEVNPWRSDSPQLKKQIPNNQKRLEFLAAESLFHELIHATILIERTFPAGATRTQVFTDFDRMWTVATSNKLRKERDAVKARLAILMGRASVPKDAVAVGMDKHFEFLINEKFTKQTAASAFGRSWNNSEIAKAYTNIVAWRIEGSGTPDKNQTEWNKHVHQLRDFVNRLYEKIDQELGSAP